MTEEGIEMARQTLRPSTDNGHVSKRITEPATTMGEKDFFGRHRARVGDSIISLKEGEGNLLSAIVLFSP